jgi:hypothetical protein
VACCPDGFWLGVTSNDARVISGSRLSHCPAITLPTINFRLDWVGLRISTAGSRRLSVFDPAALGRSAATRTINNDHLPGQVNAAPLIPLSLTLSCRSRRTNCGRLFPTFPYNGHKHSGMLVTSPQSLMAATHGWGGHRGRRRSPV